MIAENFNGDKWKQTTMKKLISFCEKCPCVLATRTASQNGQDGVFIIHKNTGNEYFFPWDFTKDPQVFIHDIKEYIKPRHYPLLIETEYEEHQLTPQELATMVESGKSIKELPKYERRVKSQKLWRIDKVILWKNIVIMERVPMNKDETVPTSQFRFKYNKNLVIFLKKYRSGEFATLQEAGDVFFNENN
jgi:hypothetical protein